jgi:hypothetical protein
MPSRIIKFPSPPGKPGEAADVHPPRFAVYAPAGRRELVENPKGPAYSVVSILVKFIFYVTVFYTGWHLLASYKIISAQPTSGWIWLLAMRAVWSEIDRLIDDLEAKDEAKDKASGATGFWPLYRRRVLSSATEAAAFSTIILLLGWLTDAFQFTAVLAGTVTGSVLIGATQAAGRLRHPIWLVAIDDFSNGAFCGALIPALAYVFWFSANGGPSDQGIWYFGTGLCAVIGGGINLWRKKA